MAFSTRLAFFEALFLILFNAINCGPIGKAGFAAVPISMTTTSAGLDELSTLDERAGSKHNWAFVCTEEDMITTNRNLFYECTNYPIGGWCDGEGISHYKYYATYNCELHCSCVEVGASNIANCVWGIQALICGHGKKKEDISQSEAIQDTVGEASVPSVLENAQTGS